MTTEDYNQHNLHYNAKLCIEIKQNDAHVRSVVGQIV